MSSVDGDDSRASRPGSVRAVLFDFGGVLTETPGAALDAIARESGCTLPELATLLLGAYHEDTDHPWHRLERGEIPFDDLCRWARDEGVRRGWKLDLTGLPRLMGGLELRPRAVETVREIRERGLATALVTNNVREFRTEWETRFPLGELFDAVIDSSEVGIRKPDPRIYRLVLERLGAVPPEAAVLLDDFEGNLGGAATLGIRGILVGHDWETAFRELDRLLGDA